MVSTIKGLQSSKLDAFMRGGRRTVRRRLRFLKFLDDARVLNQSNTSEVVAHRRRRIGLGIRDWSWGSGCRVVMEVDVQATPAVGGGQGGNRRRWRWDGHGRLPQA